MENITNNPAKKPLVILFGNEKGGVSKTSCTLLTAATLTKLGFKICVCDCDPSGNLSHAVLKDDPKYVLYDVFTNRCTPEQAIYHTEFGDIIPTEKKYDAGNSDSVFGLSKSLQDFFTSQANNPNCEKWLTILFTHPNFAPTFAKYDFILLDSAPKDGMIVVNSIVCADYVILPCTASESSWKGVNMFISSIMDCNRLYGSHVQVDGVLLSMYDDRWATSRDSAQTIISSTSEHSIPVYDTKIHNCPSIKEIMNRGIPITETQHYSDCGLVDSMNFALEFLRHHGMTPRTHVPGVIPDENGNLCFVRNGYRCYGYTVENNVAQAYSFSIRLEDTETDEWKAALGKTLFLTLDAMDSHLKSAGLTRNERIIRLTKKSNVFSAEDSTDLVAES